MTLRLTPEPDVIADYDASGSDGVVGAGDPVLDELELRTDLLAPVIPMVVANVADVPPRLDLCAQLGLDIGLVPDSLLDSETRGRDRATCMRSTVPSAFPSGNRFVSAAVNHSPHPAQAAPHLKLRACLADPECPSEGPTGARLDLELDVPATLEMELGGKLGLPRALNVDGCVTPPSGPPPPEFTEEDDLVSFAAKVLAWVSDWPADVLSAWEDFAGCVVDNWEIVTEEWPDSGLELFAWLNAEGERIAPFAAIDFGLDEIPGFDDLKFRLGADDFSAELRPDRFSVLQSIGPSLGIDTETAGTLGCLSGIFRAPVKFRLEIVDVKVPYPAIGPLNVIIDAYNLAVDPLGGAFKLARVEDNGLAEEGDWNLDFEADADFGNGLGCG